MFSLQEYQHVHLLWFKKQSFTLVWEPNPPLRSVRYAHLLVLTRRVKAQWARAAPLCIRAASALLTRAVWNGRKPGSTVALALKAPLFTWSVKSFSCYNVLLWSSADHALAQLWPRQIFTRTLSKNGRKCDHFGHSLEPCNMFLFLVFVYMGHPYAGTTHESLCTSYQATSPTSPNLVPKQLSGFTELERSFQKFPPHLMQHFFQFILQLYEVQRCDQALLGFIQTVPGQLHQLVLDKSQDAISQW